MSMAAKYYFESEHGVKIHDNSITMIPLQGEGKVEERVDKLFNSLVNNPAWMSALISADVILWATHSQGTPVSTLLLRRLLDRELVNVQRQAVSLLAMAGSLIVKYFEADAARELFEFMDSNSTISQKFADSLGYILRRGIKTTLIGSMQDQVVPLYSAIMTGTSHPNILRGMYIDSHIYSQDDFLISIISFALRLRNVGLSDHGLLTHISEVLAGNLYSLEGGHSTIYEELDVYVIAVRHLFETAPFGQQKLVCSYVSSDAVVNLTDKRSLSASKDLITPMEAKIDPFQSKVRLNPFYLPWAMRGIFDDTRISNDPILSQELKNLKVLYDSWSPASAKLREIKFRLEPLKAKL
ncbi:hypothetical protein J3Q64DRAFT_1635613 [Phycomyces blakesleeanus]|uniref:YMC020W-like alpha/beta hydrolase domain-containing protein n=1 Tax=Phycomyces blakesleeanus TaxID=4837 RepID=A0ABR3B8P0_PHYBL